MASLRHWIVAALVVAGVLSLHPSAAAQPLTRPVKILVGFPAGGTIDVVTREIAEHLRESLGVPVIVENPTGAGGQLAAQALKRAAPDGLTLMVAPDHTLVIIPETLKAPGFDVAKDFVPIGMVADYAGALAVSKASGTRDLAGWIARAKASAAPTSVGVAAPGSKPVFAMHALSRQQGAQFNAVPYRGSVPMVQDLTGGHIDAGITALGDFLEQHRSDRLRIVAVTGDKRVASLPDVPTARESGLPIAMDFWIAMLAPAGTPAPLVAHFNQALNRALADPKVKARMAQLVFDPAPGEPGVVARRIDAERRYWTPLIEAAGWVKQ
jgi:tripartite-type tricarboxylate transporter receptor subunit TctC